MLGHRVVRIAPDQSELTVIAVQSIIAPVAVRLVQNKKGKNIAICMTYDKVC